MSLKEQLEEDLKDAMRQKDTLRRSVIRYVRSAIHNEEIAKQGDLNDDAVLQVLTKQAQQRRDSIEAFEQANRDDLVSKEKAELEIIQAYLPEPMSREEITEIVRQTIAEVGASSPGDMGKVMSQVMPKLRGRAGGKEVNDIASELLREASA